MAVLFDSPAIASPAGVRFGPPVYVPAGGTTAINGNIECANVDVAASTVLDEDGLEPIILVRCRPASWVGRVPGGVSNWLLKLTGCLGKRPIVRFLRVDRRLDARPIADDHIGVWTADALPGRNWTAFPSRVLNADYIEVQFPTALEVDDVIVATQPVQGPTDYGVMVAELLADPAGRWQPAIGADANGVIGTSPSEIDDRGVQVGNQPIYSIVFDDGRAPVDGGPKRTLIMMAHVHAMGEGTSGVRCAAALDWITNDVSAEADAFRSNFLVFLSGPQNPNGLAAGHSRWSISRSPVDFNRMWYVPGFGLDVPTDTIPAEVALIMPNIAANVATYGRGLDVHIGWHTHPTSSDVDVEAEFWLYPTDVDPLTRSPITQAYLDACTSVMGAAFEPYTDSPLGETTPTHTNYSKLVHGARLAGPAELPNFGNTNPAMHAQRGRDWLRALQIVDANEALTNWDAGQAVTGTPNLRTRRALADGVYDVTVRATAGADVRTQPLQVTVAAGVITAVEVV